ncbi:hypothetical protein [Paraburkholderia sabiae]|uniref:hypothetical protein n=1 Tax=Paraburkholderia sabiae TaxID=273251 RepID=UPI00319E466E
MLRKVYPISNADPLNCKSAKDSQNLLAELDVLFRSGSTENLHQAARLLNVTETFLHKLAPEIAASLVQRGTAIRHCRRIQREEARFHDFWQSFQELRFEGIYPARVKVLERMRRRTGKGLGFREAARFHKRAFDLAETSPYPSASPTRTSRD